MFKTEPSLVQLEREISKMLIMVCEAEVVFVEILFTHSITRFIRPVQVDNIQVHNIQIHNIQVDTKQVNA